MMARRERAEGAVDELSTSTLVPLVQVQVHLGYRLGGLGLGLGGLERSQWVGTSCNFSSSPPRQVQVHLGCASVNLALTRGT